MNSSKGYVITGSISSIKDINCDQVWQITRSNKTISGTVWVPELSPSNELFNTYLHEWKEKQPDQWWVQYSDQFNRELQTKEKLDKLRSLWKLIQNGKIIALVCFCKDDKYCHRSLIGKFLEKSGVRVEEYKKIKYRKNEEDFNSIQQLTLF